MSTTDKGAIPHFHLEGLNIVADGMDDVVAVATDQVWAEGLVDYLNGRDFLGEVERRAGASRVQMLSVARLIYPINRTDTESLADWLRRILGEPK